MSEFAEIDTASKELQEAISDLKSRVTLSDESMQHLYNLYSAIWSEACYDPYNESTEKFARKLLPHIQALNKELRFRK